MKLRTLIFLFLLLLGLAPLVVAIAMNLPMGVEKLEEFYHKAYLQQLRADFRDLDQHITRRQELVRLFAKLPEPGIALSAEDAADAEHLVQLRQGYADWANRVLFDALDITQVIFIGSDGKVSLALNRNQQTGTLESNTQVADLPRLDFLSAGLKVSPGSVLTSPITLDPSPDPRAPNRFMTLRFISPLITGSAEGGLPELRGVVVFNIDVGGLAHAYQGIYWVQDNGEYLGESALSEAPHSTAFEDFPGLDTVFDKGELALWERDGRQIFWLPLFSVQDRGPLWVGRSVDASPIADFIGRMEIRLTIVISVLLVVVFLVARFIAIRTERISHELTQKMSRVLEKDEPVAFSWKRPEELKTLGDTLTRLAEKHVQDTQAVKAHTRALEQSNRYKSEFLANVSHELRTPLNSILLLSKMQADTGNRLPEENRQQARVIHSAGRDLRALIDTILDLSRIEAGKATLDIGAIDLPALLDDLVSLMRPQFEEKGLTLELATAVAAPAHIHSDTEKLRQILINFLSNALKFTDQGVCRLRLDANGGADSAALPVAISVQDSGIGIPDAQQAQVFEAFSQVDGSTSRRYGGTGLGLTISRQLADLLGGRIEVQSSPGSGSTFTLLLPARCTQTGGAGNGAANSDAVAPPTAGEDDIRIPAASYADSRVLLVDDDIRNLLALTPLLENWQIQVVAAGDGQEALDTLADDNRFDLIIMDLMMPQMDGFEAMQRIRQTPELAQIPMIALTAKAGDDDRERARACGAGDFLAKPVEPVELKRALDQYLAAQTGKDA